jgi:hypothetical protein
VKVQMLEICRSLQVKLIIKKNWWWCWIVKRKTEVAATVEEDECEVHNLDDEFEGNEDYMEDMGFDENVLKDLIN